MLERPTENKYTEHLKGFLEISPNKFDLREIKSLDELDTLLVSLVKEKHILLHGTPYEIMDGLEPKLANDLNRETGSQNAVYATDFPERAIFHAVLNRAYLMDKFDGFVSGYSNSGTQDGRLEFKVTQNVKDLIDNGDASVFCDGFIYLLNKANFVRSEDGESEFQSKDGARPVASLLVSKDLGNDIKERTRAYRPEELEKK